MAGSADSWRRERRFSGNNLMTLGILYESVARWLGHATEVTAVTATFDPWQPGPDGVRVGADVPDHAVLVARFPDRLLATFEISATSRAEPPNAITLFGSRGALRVDIPAALLERTASADPGRWEPVAIPDDERHDWRVEAEFVGAIRGTETVGHTDFATGVRYMAFTDAVHLAAAEGRRVAIP